MKNPGSEPRPPTQHFGKLRRTRRHFLGAGLAAFLAFLCACGELRPHPGGFEPQAYTPLEYQELVNPRQVGQMVRVKAYFWQQLDYDPAPLRNYLSLARHPLGWSKLRWFALYGSEDLKGYYDLAAMDASRLKLFQPKRLEPILVYGQLSSLGQGCYLHVHHLERAPEE